MVAFWLNRSLSPFRVTLAILGGSAIAFLVVELLNGGGSEYQAFQIAGGVVVLLYFLRALTYVFSPYQVALAESEVRFPARPTADTYRWWEPSVRGLSVRYFVSQEFEASLSNGGFRGVLRFADKTFTVVEYGAEEITSVCVCNKGLAGLELRVALRSQAEPFVVTVQGAVWPFSNRNSIAEATRNVTSLYGWGCE